MTLTNRKVFVTGRDGYGWSIDSDRLHTVDLLQKAGAKTVGNPVTAGVIHSVWWKSLFGRKGQLQRFLARFGRKHLVATVTNEIERDDANFEHAKQIVDVWIAGNRKQQKDLLDEGLRAFWQPFYVDESIFMSRDRDRKQLCSELGIDPAEVAGRFLIANFQRDSLMSDLKKPKQQKDPNRLIRILSRLPNRDNWALLLAGPRRHYVISECEKLGIPYVYAGLRPLSGIDDIRTNVQPAERIAKLYELADCSLTTSQWEGGPKAILESAYAKAYVLSTPVGNAPDILPNENLFSDDDEAVTKLEALVNNVGTIDFSNKVSELQQTVLDVCGVEKSVERLQEIYESV